MCRFIFPILITVSVATTVPSSLPPHFKICSRNEPDLDGCVKSAIEIALPIMKSGLRSLGVPSIDPLHLNRLFIAQGSGPVAINLEFKDIQIVGITSAKVTSVSTSVDGNTGHLKVSATIVNPLLWKGKYVIKGQVLVLPISGAGNCEIELHESNVVLDFAGREIVNNGEKFLIWDSIKFSADPSLMKLKFENLFNGDAALGDNMNKFLNDNWQQVYGELQDPIQRAFGATILQLVNIIFSKIPSNQLLPF